MSRRRRTVALEQRLLDTQGSAFPMRIRATLDSPGQEIVWSTVDCQPEANGGGTL